MEATKRFYSLDANARISVKFINFTDVWRIHPIAIMAIASDFLAAQRTVKIRCVANPWVSRFLDFHGYGDLLTRGAVSNKQHGFRGLKHYLENDAKPHLYVKKLLHDVMERRQCGKDILESLEWASAELIGNVFDHAESPIGVMVQYVIQPIEGYHRFIFSVVDRGIGLQRSLGEKYRDLENDAQAIELAIQKGVTSKRENFGWGLFGSTALVRAAKGRFMLWSGSQALFISDLGRESYREMPFLNGTAIEWVLPTNTDIDIGAALQRKTNISSLELDNYEPEPGVIALKLRDESTVFSARSLGKKLRIKLLNLVENSRAKRCIVDFSAVGTVSSSFADEFLGKTAWLLGDRFSDFVKIVHISEVNGAICEVAIQGRLQKEREAATPLRVRRI